FDMNFPGIYLVHTAGLLAFGPGDAGFRALDLVVLAGVSGGLAVALAPAGRTPALAGVALFWLYHLAGGGWRAGQRDYILCLPLAWAAAGIVADLRRPGDRSLALVGLALGAAVWLKPFAVVLTPLALA